MAKAILLLSGGLDSVLAGKMILDQGVDVEAVHFVHPFNEGNRAADEPSAAERMAEQLGIPVDVIEWGKEFLDIIRNPRHGYGSAMNPCIDCRVYSFRCAAKYLKERGADFIVTGEVQGQRPMSQRRFTIDLIEHESGMAGLIVRPLCAKLLPPSIAEQKGLIDRQRLLDIQGRSRTPQMKLAEELGIRDYVQPGGGCLLTDKEFSARLRDLFEHEPGCNMDDVRMLKHGRHFRIPGGAKIIVGRNEADNNAMESLLKPGDRFFEPESIPGPTVVCRGSNSEKDIGIAAALVASYTKGKDAIDVKAAEFGGEEEKVLRKVNPLEKSDLENWRIRVEKS
ncbi:MAG: 7-cyano-7-deazaguanine synthase [Planctomycetota bacterium]|jgi:tRNA U34 2-thiouridine synthase MnmA/TrmU